MSNDDPYGRPTHEQQPTGPQTTQQFSPPPWAAPATPYTPPPSTRVPAWLWPAVAVLSLVLGLLGGAVGGYLVADHSEGDGSGGLLKVERRTAAPLNADNASVPAVAAEVLPSTVQILAEYKGDPQGVSGSGFVIDKQGHIITNNHVVADAARDHGAIEIIDSRGRHSKAEVVGRSPVYDLAVLRADGAKKLTPAAIGSSEQMHVGETVIAFGSPLGLSSSVTSGIISALDRPVTTGDADESSYINAVQTDAAINPGNSGGPLVNLQGQVVGVNSAIATNGGTAGDEGGNIGVGFSIPIEQVQITTDQILRTGKAQYPVIGANVKASRERNGAVIDAIPSGTPADDAGLKAGDLVTAVDGKSIDGSIGLVVAIRTHQPGEKVSLTVRRDGHERTISIVLDGKTG